VSSVEVEIARREWEEARAALEAHAGDRRRYVQLLDQVEAVLAELRKRVGQTFTLAELAAAYARSEDWAREAVAERAAAPGWERTLTLVQSAAFHVYARGAVDYQP
jgi:hypothetical protein